MSDGAALSVELLAAASAGDPTALATLLERAQPRLRRYAEQSCLLSDVDDAVQEVLLTLSRAVGSLRHAQALSTWLFRVTRRTCRRLAQVALRMDVWDESRTEHALARLPGEALRVELVAALESLPAHYREVLVLRDFEELTIAELSERLGLSPAAVKSRLHRARALTREYLVA